MFKRYHLSPLSNEMQSYPLYVAFSDSSPQQRENHVFDVPIFTILAVHSFVSLTSDSLLCDTQCTSHAFPDGSTMRIQCLESTKSPSIFQKKCDSVSFHRFILLSLLRNPMLTASVFRRYDGATTTL